MAHTDDMGPGVFDLELAQQADFSDLHFVAVQDDVPDNDRSAQSPNAVCDQRGGDFGHGNRQEDNCHDGDDDLQQQNVIQFMQRHLQLCKCEPLCDVPGIKEHAQAFGAMSKRDRVNAVRGMIFAFASDSGMEDELR